jgi:hypothetical protein
MLRLGSTGQAVVEWQRVLGINGIDVTIDGQYGPLTEAATRQLQARLGITADGVVGPATRAALERAERGTWPDLGIDVAARIVSEALSVQGYHGATDEHAELCGIPKAVLGKRFGAGGVSTCGLVAEGIHRRIGIDAPVLYRPYVYGTAITRAIEYMREMGAWQWATGQRTVEPRPQPGDYVVIGRRSAGESVGGTEHALTCVGWDGDVLVSVDGGQTHPASGLQCITERRRRWELVAGVLWLRDVPGASGRKVLGWGSAGRLRVRG